MKKGSENKMFRLFFGNKMERNKKVLLMVIFIALLLVVLILILTLFIIGCDRQGIVVDNNPFFGQNQSSESPQNIESEDAENDASVEKLDDESVDFGEYTAFTVERSGKNYMILKKGDQEIIIDQKDAGKMDGLDNLGYVGSFSSIQFSRSGRYLLYSARGYEGSYSSVYDIANAKIVISSPLADIGDNFNFTPDEKYLYYCLGNGLIEGVPGQVYSVPDFKKVFDVPVKNVVEYTDYNCKYDSGKNAIVFTMSDANYKNIPQSKEVIYPLGN